MLPSSTSTLPPSLNEPTATSNIDDDKVHKPEENIATDEQEISMNGGSPSTEAAQPTTKIPRPRRGYVPRLREDWLKLSLDEWNYLTEYCREVRKAHTGADAAKTISKVDPQRVTLVIQQICQQYPFFNDYEKQWPLWQILMKGFRNKASYTRAQKRKSLSAASGGVSKPPTADKSTQESNYAAGPVSSNSGDVSIDQQDSVFASAVAAENEPNRSGDVLSSIAGGQVPTAVHNHPRTRSGIATQQASVDESPVIFHNVPRASDVAPRPFVASPTSTAYVAPNSQPGPSMATSSPRFMTPPIVLSTSHQPTSIRQPRQGAGAGGNAVDTDPPLTTTRPLKRKNEEAFSSETNSQRQPSKRRAAVRAKYFISLQSDNSDQELSGDDWDKDSLPDVSTSTPVSAPVAQNKSVKDVPTSEAPAIGPASYRFRIRVPGRANLQETAGSVPKPPPPDLASPQPSTSSTPITNTTLDHNTNPSITLTGPSSSPLSSTETCVRPLSPEVSQISQESDSLAHNQSSSDQPEECQLKHPPIPEIPDVSDQTKLVEEQESQKQPEHLEPPEVLEALEQPMQPAVDILEQPTPEQPEQLAQPQPDTTPLPVPMDTSIEGPITDPIVEPTPAEEKGVAAEPQESQPVNTETVQSEKATPPTREKELASALAAAGEELERMNELNEMLMHNLTSALLEKEEIEKERDSLQLQLQSSQPQTIPSAQVLMEAFRKLGKVLEEVRLKS